MFSASWETSAACAALCRYQGELIKPHKTVETITAHKKAAIAGRFLVWCGKQDLNLHEVNPHKNLNLARLPIPPFPQKVEHVVDGDGFEPSKSATADLQSAPFGHSGTHP